MRTDLTEAQRNEAKSFLLNLLRDPTTKELRVKFIKADGSLREMKCTLLEASIPVEQKPKGTSKKKLSDEAVRVFDLEANAWRSFRWDSLQSFSWEI